MKTSQPSVTIIVLNYNGIEDTTNCLKSLITTKYSNFNIQVVDNGSKINEIDLLKKIFKQKFIKYTRFNKNYGFTGGSNRIAKKARTKYLVFLNNDTVVEPNWLNRLVKTTELDPKIVACQPKILLMDDKSKFDYAGGSGGVIDKYGYPFTRGRLFFSSEQDNKQYNLPKELFWASGAAMIVRRDIFKQLGMFDESFFLYMEEIDFCWRAINKGFKILSVPSSVVYHKVAGSTKKNLARKRYYEHRNNLILLTKNYSRHDMITLFPRRILFELVTLFFYFLKMDVKSLIGFIYAHVHFWIIFPNLIKVKNGHNQDISHFKGLSYQKSVVIDYFIKRKKRFSDYQI